MNRVLHRVIGALLLAPLSALAEPQILGSGSDLSTLQAVAASLVHASANAHDYFVGGDDFPAYVNTSRQLYEWFFGYWRPERADVVRGVAEQITVAVLTDQRIVWDAERQFGCTGDTYAYVPGRSIESPIVFFCDYFFEESGEDVLSFQQRVVVVFHEYAHLFSGLDDPYYCRDAQECQLWAWMFPEKAIVAAEAYGFALTAAGWTDWRRVSQGGCAMRIGGARAGPEGVSWGAVLVGGIIVVAGHRKVRRGSGRCANTTSRS